MNIFDGPIVDITKLSTEELKHNLSLVLQAGEFDKDDIETFKAFSEELARRTV